MRPNFTLCTKLQRIVTLRSRDIYWMSLTWIQTFETQMTKRHSTL
ncbi:hypothetical protein CCHR01_01705 [Colletotrichum chrysophilum]|uniref:Uncharacterized protein n=1 Tax=Colletotrichum chrysophilum TaxID=1836956 RepID=A0AAD9ET40_9PEZI|nr:hypothetical protein CCHR01_01705 [Colletotrichum chrysophilum]